MKAHPAPGSTAVSSPATVDRRRVVAAGSVVAASAVAAAALHRGALSPSAVDTAKLEPDKGDGYRLTEHVLRYYETTRA